MSPLTRRIFGFLKLLKENRVSQKSRVLKHLQNGHSINNLIATKEYGCVGSSLAYIIFSLRKDGHKIATETKTTANSTSYAEYTIIRDEESNY